MPSSEHSYADINDARLRYDIKGEGHPLVLIHGYTLDRRMWDDQFDVFARHYRVLRYDLRGFGESTLPAAKSYSYYDDLRALLDHLDIDRAHILGLSLGGAVAIDFTLTYPERVSTLVLADVSALGGFPYPAPLGEMFAAITAAAQQSDIAAAKAYWLNSDWFAPARSRPRVYTRLKQMVADYSGWHFANTNPLHKLSPPANERLQEIRAPTLVIIGERDLPTYNYPIADRLKQEISGAEKAVIPNAGHMTNMEDPDVFNELVLSFLAKHQTS